MNKLILYPLIALTLGVAIGYKLMPTKTVTKVEIIKEETTKKNVDTIKVREKKPDGTVITRTETKDRSETSSTERKDSLTVVDRSSKFNLSLLAGVAFTEATPVYGLSLSKEVLGPFSLGVWGLTNKTGGISIGISF